MKIIFCSVAWEDIGKKFSEMAAPLQVEFNSIFSERSYGAGISEFQAILIAVDSTGDLGANEKFARQREKSGTYKHLLTGERIKYISFAIKRQHEDLEGKNTHNLRSIFCHDLHDRMDHAAIEIPKGFDYASFSTDMKGALKKYF